MRIRITAIQVATMLIAVIPAVIHPGLNEVAAAEAADAATKVVAPYLDEQTFAVAHVNLARLDADAAFDRFAKLAGVNPQVLAGARRPVHEAVAAFHKAGAKDLYAVFSAADLPLPGPFVLVPRAGTNDDELKTALGVLGTEVVEPLDGLMFAGPKQARERLRGLKPAARPDLEPALAAVAGAQLQVALIPSADQRRVVGELMPTLPKEVGGGPGTVVTKGVQWAALGFDAKPKLAVKLVVKSEDASAAKALADVAERGLDSAMREQTVRRIFPKANELVKVVRPRVEGDHLTIAVDEAAPGVAGGFASLIGQARSTAGRTQSMNNLKQMALAWHNFLDVNRGTCPGTIKSKDGKPLLSWRVAILPYIEQNDLYLQFKLDEPWDSEHNKKLIEKMPAVYRSPAQKVGDWKTTYLAPTGMAGSFHIGLQGITFPKDVPDGTSNTIMLVESNDEAAVVWTKPDDLTVDPKDPFKGLLGHYEKGFLTAFADGSVQFLSQAGGPMNLLALFTRDGGEVVNR